VFERLLRETPPNIVVMGCWGRYGETPPLAYLEGELVTLTRSGEGVCGERVGGESVGPFRVPVKPEELRQRPEPQLTLDKSKVYVCLDMSDGTICSTSTTPSAARSGGGSPDRGR